MLVVSGVEMIFRNNFWTEKMPRKERKTANWNRGSTREVRKRSVACKAWITAARGNPVTKGSVEHVKQLDFAMSRSKAEWQKDDVGIIAEGGVLVAQGCNDWQAALQPVGSSRSTVELFHEETEGAAPDVEEEKSKSETGPLEQLMSTRFQTETLNRGLEKKEWL